MEKYLYSIVIPHYNSANLLTNILESIPERDDIQIIIVDDCSDAKEVSHLKSLEHKNLEIVLLETNGGAGHARNVGLERIKGEWSVFADADDRFAPETFDVFDQYINEDLDCIHFKIAFYTPTSSCIDEHPNHVGNTSVSNFLKRNDKNSFRFFALRNTNCWNKLVKTSFIKSNNIHFAETPVNNDVLYAYMVLLRSRKFTILPNILYWKYSNDMGITGKPRSVEREFLFFKETIKRNALFAHIKLKKYPFYRSLYLYIPFLIKKHGIKYFINFSLYYIRHKKECEDDENFFVSYFKDLDLNQIDNLINGYVNFSVLQKEII